MCVHTNVRALMACARALVRACMFTQRWRLLSTGLPSSLENSKVERLEPRLGEILTIEPMHISLINLIQIGVAGDAESDQKWIGTAETPFKISRYRFRTKCLNPPYKLIESTFRGSTERCLSFC